MELVSSVRPTGKFPEKVENLKRWSRFPGWNFRTECRVPFTFLVVCTSSRSTVGHRHVPGFTTKWNNFLPIGNSTFATTEISGFFVFFKLNPKKSLMGRRENLGTRLGHYTRKLRTLGNIRWKKAWRSIWRRSLVQRKTSKSIQGLSWSIFMF